MLDPTAPMRPLKEEVYRETAGLIEEGFGKDEEQDQCPGVG